MINILCSRIFFTRCNTYMDAIKKHSKCVNINFILCLFQIMLCFSRDTEITQWIQIDFANLSKSKQYEGPPSGIVPFHGICMFGIFIRNQLIKSTLMINMYIKKFISNSLKRLHFVTYSIHLNNCISHFVHFTFDIVIG